MRCEDCPSRACLNNGGVCDPRTCTSSLKDCLHPRQFNPPTDKQINLVQAYLRYNRFIKHPDYSKQAYYEFIRDVVVKDVGFRYYSTRVQYIPDEDDDIIGFCQDDVWCEEY